MSKPDGLTGYEPGEDWPDDQWPDEDDDGDEEPHGQWPPPDWPKIPELPVYGGRPARWPRWARLTVTAVVGLAVGAAATYAVRDMGSASPAATGQPETGSSGSSGSPQVPGGAVPSGAYVVTLIDGRVRAVSPTSITIGSGPRSITAAVTSATRFSGHVTRIGQVRVGDLVLAQIAGGKPRGSVVALQDPASLP